VISRIMGRMASNPWKSATHALAVALTGWIQRERDAGRSCGAKDSAGS
jgi:hypothetical protein